MILRGLLTLIFLFFFIEEAHSQGFGFVEVVNAGGYVARFSITYEKAGKEITRSSGDFPIDQSRIILTPSGATKLRVNIQCMTFFGVYAAIMSQSVPSSSKCYILYGTVFEPRWYQINC